MLGKHKNLNQNQLEYLFFASASESSGSLIEVAEEGFTNYSNGAEQVCRTITIPILILIPIPIPIP